MNFSFTHIAYAADVDSFILSVNDKILNPVIKLMFAVAFIVFLWGVSQMVLKAESEEGRTTGKQHILWGVIGMTIMFSVWGIMNLILATIGVTGIDPQKGKVQLEDYNPKYPPIKSNSSNGTTIITPSPNSPTVNFPTNFPDQSSSGPE